MSTSEPTVQDPNQNSNPPEPDHLAGALAPDIPPDPLLQSGSFIASNLSNGETLNKTHPNENYQIPQPPDPPQVRQSFEGAPASVAAENSFFAEPVTQVPAPENPAFAAESRAGRGRRKGTEPPAAAAAGGTPDWLPPNWIVEDRVRSSGVTAGMIDKVMEFLGSKYGVVILESAKGCTHTMCMIHVIEYATPEPRRRSSPRNYYYDPVSGHRFRSKIEVLYFLQTGTLRKRKKLVENSDVDTPLENSGNHKQKKSGTRTKSSALNFDYVNVPEKIRWVLTDSFEGTWTPLVNDEAVPESSKQEWAAAFASLTARNGGHATH